jgi:SOS response regulatory protein OraA/RecX
LIFKSEKQEKPMRLHETVKAQERELTALSEGIRDLSAYLQSEKFWEDPTVQVCDVLNRLSWLRDAAMAAKYDATEHRAPAWVMGEPLP